MFMEQTGHPLLLNHFQSISVHVIFIPNLLSAVQFELTTTKWLGIVPGEVRVERTNNRLQSALTSQKLENPIVGEQ